MNPKILLAFLGGAAVAGVLAFVLTTRSSEKPATVQQDSVHADGAVQQPIAKANGNAADVAATVEQVKPAPVDMARRTMKLPKPAPVTVRKGSVAEPVKQAAQTENVDNAGGVVLPPFSNGSNRPAPVETAKNDPEPRRTEILRPDPNVKQAARTPETVTVPVGTSISVRINSTLSSEKNEAGDSFSAVLESPLIVNDIVLAERGARVEGKVVEADKSGRVKGVGKISVALTRITLSDGQRVEIQTDPFIREAASEKGKDAAKIGVMAGIGAAIGAIAGGGKGAAIGGASGAGAGTGVVLATKGKAAQLDVESKIPFRLKDALTVTERIR